MVESNNNEESLRKVVSIYDSDETARILAQHDDNNQANIDMARKASGLEKQVSVEVKSSKQTVQDMKDFQNEYDQKIKQLTTTLAKSELKHADAEPATPVLVAAASQDDESAAQAKQ